MNKEYQMIVALRGLEVWIKLPHNTPISVMDEIAEEIPNQIKMLLPEIVAEKFKEAGIGEKVEINILFSQPMEKRF